MAINRSSSYGPRGFGGTGLRPASVRLRASKPSEFDQRDRYAKAFGRHETVQPGLLRGYRKEFPGQKLPDVRVKGSGVAPRAAGSLGSGSMASDLYVRDQLGKFSKS